MPSDPAGFVDSHAHLDMEDFDADRDEVLERALRAAVQTILCPADLTNPRSLQTILDLGRKHKGTVRAAAGVHPHQAKDFSPAHLDEIRRLASSGAICAVGEVGLDFFYNFSPAEAQRGALRQQVALAGELRLPLIVHTRQAGPQAADIIFESGFRGRGVLHCYTETWDLARTMLDRGFYISFTGILTFPKAQAVRDVARKIPLDRLMVETDSPYLVPVPRRGRLTRNEPAFVVDVARALAEVKGLSLEELAEVTTRNFRALFCV
jgi:TatD DNase family protein